MLPELPDADLIERVKAAVERMPPRRRNIFLLSRVEGWTYHQIADAYGISRRRVASDVRRAMKRLRRATRPQDLRWWERLWPF